MKGLAFATALFVNATATLLNQNYNQHLTGVGTLLLDTASTSGHSRLAGRQVTCPANQKICDERYCIPSDASCCSTNNGLFCYAPTTCLYDVLQESIKCLYPCGAGCSGGTLCNPADDLCYPGCADGSTFCKNGACSADIRCLQQCAATVPCFEKGYICGQDGLCHEACPGKPNIYCTTGICGSDNQCHAACPNGVDYCPTGQFCGSDDKCTTGTATTTATAGTTATGTSITTSTASSTSSASTSTSTASTSTTPVPVSSDSNNPNLAAIIGGVVGGVVGIALIGGGAYYAAKKARADVDKERPIMVSGITQGEMATVPKFPPPGPMPLTTNGTALSASSLATTSTLASASSGTLPPTMAPLLVLPTTPPTTADPSTLPSQYQPRAQSSVAQDIPSNVAEPLPVAPLLLPVDPSLPMRCTRPFKAGMEDELDVETGDVVNVLVRHEDGWGLVKRVAPISGEGMIPLSILEPLPTQ